MSSPLQRIHLTGPARRDITSIARYTLRTFGLAATERYNLLIRQALRDIQDDPDRPGSKTLPEAFGSPFRLYHLSFSRERVTGERVKEPRHFIVYQRKADNMIEVLRVLHESRDLPRHLPQER